MTGSYGQLPLAFEPNAGQTGTRADFLARGSGYSVLLDANQASVALQQASAGDLTTPSGSTPTITTELLTLRLVGSNASAPAVPLDKLASVSNYLIGNDPNQWHTNVANYGRVEYQNVYAGIDQIYYGNQGQLEYDLVVNPGANPGNIRLAIAGAQSMSLDAGGSLVLHMAGGDVVEQAPVVYQQVNGVRRSVAGRYVFQDGQQVGFAVGAYDASLPLIIDPVLRYSTYLGGNGNENGNSIAVDAAGNAYVAGFSLSSNFPTAVARQGTLKGTEDAFVSKLNTQGNALVYSTYLGGNGGDVGYHIAVDAAGNAYVTGQTGSTDFPTANAFQSTLKGSGDAFVTKLNSQGNALVYSTYLGGTNLDDGNSITVDTAGDAYVTGFAYSTDFPTANALQSAHKGPATNAFVTKLNPQGSALVYSTYLGGTGTQGDDGNGIAVDSAGNAYVTGFTTSTDFPTANALQSTNKGTFTSAYVAKLNPQGSVLVYSTYLGGSGSGGDNGFGIAADAAGNAYVTGRTGSTDFPTANAFQRTLKGTSDAFVTKLNAPGSVLVYSTYLGGTGAGLFEESNAIALDAAGNAYIAGQTSATDFPTVNALQGSLNGTQDAFVSMINAQGSALVYSTYLGGTGSDFASGIAVDGAGSAYVTGTTLSTDFPTAGALQRNLAGGSDAFVAKILSHAFNGRDVAVDSTGHGQLLWDSFNGQSVQWAVDNSINVNFGPVFGPFTGWTAVANAAGSGDLTRILWTNTDGRAALWLEDDSDMIVSHIFSAISGWSAQDITVASDGTTRILWTHTTGAMVVWSVDNNFNVSSSPVYGPFGGWTAAHVAAGADGLIRVLWDNTSGAAAIWLLNANGSLANTAAFGPFTGFTATDVTVGPDTQTRILWDNVDGGALVWTLSSSFAVASTPKFGPLPGWTAERLADGSDGIVRLLWDNVDGTTALWLLDANGHFLTAGVFGPM